MKQPDFVHVGTNLHILKLTKKYLVWRGENGCGQSGHRTQKLTVS